MHGDCILQQQYGPIKGRHGLRPRKDAQGNVLAWEVFKRDSPPNAPPVALFFVAHPTEVRRVGTEAHAFRLYRNGTFPGQSGRN